MKHFKAILIILILTLTINYAFAESLDDFPYNFLEGSNKLFTARIVIGSNSADLKAANSLVNHLNRNFDIRSDNKTQITYGKSWQRLDRAQVSNFNNQLNLDEFLKDARSTSINKSHSEIILDDGTIDLKSSEDYSQHIYFEDNGFLNLQYSGENRGKGLLNFTKGNLLSYELKLDNSMDITDLDLNDLIGKDLKIMGNNFIFLKGWESVLAMSTRTFDKFKLIRADDIEVLKEGEARIIDVGHNSYNLKVDKIRSSSVDFIINNEEVSVELQESEYLGNASIGVINIGYSNNENASNYVEVLIGDVELILQDTKELKINGELASDYFEDLTILTTMQSTLGEGWDGFKLTYRLTNDDGFALEKGKSFDDPLFNAFKLVFRGSNYETFRDSLPDFESFIYADVDLDLGRESKIRDITFTNPDKIDELVEFLGEEGYEVFEITNFTTNGIIYNTDFLVNDTDIINLSNLISIGGPAINNVTARILNLSFPTKGTSSGVNENEGVIKYFEDLNSLVIYGYDEADTAKAVNRLRKGNLTTNIEFIK